MGQCTADVKGNVFVLIALHVTNSQLSESLEFRWLPAGTQPCSSGHRLWVSSEEQLGLQ